VKVVAATHMDGPVITAAEVEAAAMAATSTRTLALASVPD
jgi:hypothetical protein